MIHSPRFTVILDACVLYPAPVRDLLLHLAAVELYKPKWSDTIQQSFLKSPPKTHLQVLASIEKCGLPMTCKKLLALL